jgi:PKD repeat protein
MLPLIRGGKIALIMTKGKILQVFKLLTVLVFLVLNNINAQQISWVLPYTSYVTATDSIKFSWNKQQNATTYELQVSKDSLFSTSFYSNDQLFKPDLTLKAIPAGIYFYRLRYVSGAITSDWLGTRKFTIYNPTANTHLKIWVDPSKEAIADGNKVDKLMDYSGNNAIITAADVGLRPVFKKNLLNKKSGIVYSTGNEVLTVEAPFFSQPANCFMVASSSNTGIAYFITKEPYDENGLLMANGKMALNGGNKVVISTNNNYNTGNSFIADAKYNAASSSLTVNSSLIASGELGNGGGSKLLIGGISAAQGYSIKGSISEIMLYDTVLTSKESKLVHDYLRFKFSPPVNLGSDIDISNSICDTGIYAGAGYKKYIWSTGDTTSFIHVKTSGTYAVKVLDIFGYWSSDTVIIKTKNYKTSISSGNLCAGNSIAWNTNLPKAGYQFKWQDSSADSTFLITKGGKYYVSITDSFGCTYKSDTATIHFDDFPAVASLGNDTAFCSGNKIGLIKGAATAAVYKWSTGETTPEIAIQLTGQYVLEATSSSGCSKKDTIHVTVKGTAPSAGFTIKNLCKGVTTQFTDTSLPPVTDTIDNWFWDFGDASSSTVKDPAHLYADTGTYTVSLKVTTNAGCSQISKNSVRIYSSPKADFYATVIGGFETIGFNDLSTDVNTLSSWSWNFDDPASGGNNLSTLKNPQHTFSHALTFNVQLTVINSKGCSGNIIKPVTISSKDGQQASWILPHPDYVTASQRYQL